MCSCKQTSTSGQSANPGARNKINSRCDEGRQTTILGGQTLWYLDDIIPRLLIDTFLLYAEMGIFTCYRGELCGEVALPDAGTIRQPPKENMAVET